MTRKLPKYERLYQKDRDVCGLPFQQIVDFFDSLSQANLRVLDLGCGQGRDALLIARQGHSVLGVDVAETGISQMLAEATKEKLDVEGIVADIVEFEPDEMFDVIVLDRVLHMLRDDSDRFSVLQTASHHTKVNGYILIADTPKNLKSLANFFDAKEESWDKRLESKGFLFVQRSSA